MNIYQHSLNILIAFSLFFTPLAIAENHHNDTPSFKSTQLTDNILMLQGKGGNLALLKGKQGLLLIDADYKTMSDALKAELGKHGGLGKLTYLINTHWHGDHTQGNLALGLHTKIVAHDNVRTRLLTQQEIKLFKMVSKPYPAHALPSITYKTRMTLHMNNEEIEVVHFPGGHTDGDSVVFFKKSNIVHMGDHFFNGFFPFVDIDHGGNVLKMAENIKVVLSMINSKTRIIPGHGPLSNITELQTFHDMLVGTSAEVKSMKDKGMTLEQMQKKGLSAKWKEWTDGFLSTEVWIGIVHSSMTK